MNVIISLKKVISVLFVGQKSTICKWVFSHLFIWSALCFKPILIITLTDFTVSSQLILAVGFFTGKEKQMAHKVAELLDEKCKVLETFSEVKQRVRNAMLYT